MWWKSRKLAPKFLHIVSTAVSSFVHFCIFANGHMAMNVLGKNYPNNSVAELCIVMVLVRITFDCTLVDGIFL